MGGATPIRDPIPVTFFQHKQLVPRERLAGLVRWIDWLTTCLVILAIGFGAATGGAVKRGQLLLLELNVLLLVVLCSAKIAIVAERGALIWKRKHLFLAGAGFLAWIGVELIPLSPGTIRLLSPTAYQVYCVSLPEWSARPGCSGYLAEGATLGTPNSSGTWRSLSVAPSITRFAALKLFVLAFLLWTILGYPRNRWERPDELDSVTGGILVSVIALGLVLSIIAIQGAVLLGLSRARGTFVNADHFAGFVSLIVPAAIALALSDGSLISKRWSSGVRVFAAAASFVMFASLMMSGSRAAWLGAASGSLIVLSGSRPVERGSMWGPTCRTTVRVGVCAAVLLSLFLFLGSQGRSAVGDRLNETLRTNPLLSRIGVWNDSLHMISDFPLTGVGLGAWAEIYPHYSSPPWDNNWFFGEAHNDFLQLLSETGLVGFVLLMIFVALLIREVVRSLHQAEHSIRPVLLGLSAVLLVAIPEEFFDFDLQVPANALLFVVMMGLALRLSSSKAVASAQTGVALRPALLVVLACSITAVLTLAIVWELIADPPHDPRTPAEAENYIIDDPASAQGHISMIELAGQSMRRPQYVRELRAVLWLEPANPYLRDDYARYLLHSGARVAGLNELKKSALFSPQVSTHSYLRKSVPLPADEAAAIETGLRIAIERGYRGAVSALATMYQHADHLQDAVLTYQQAARQQSDGAVRSHYLIKAGKISEEDGDSSQAERCFRQAIAAAPDKLDAYNELMRLFSRNKDLQSATAVLNDGIRHGIDPYLIDMAFVEIAHSDTQYAVAESAVREALIARPGDGYATHMLGVLYLEQSNYTRAIETFKRAIEAEWNPALDYYLLSLAEENSYDYFAAEQALRHALMLQPDNPVFKAHFKQFSDHIVENRPLQ